MIRTQWKLGALTGVLALALGVGMLAYADDTDWDFPDDETGLPKTQQYQPYQAPPTYGQGYQPYPPQYQQMPMQQPRQSILGRIFSPLLAPLMKRMSPPIDQAPKVAKEKPRETVMLKDPLIRLGRAIEYDGQRVAPGFYLLSVQPGSGEEGSTLTLKRQQQALMQVPALMSQTMASQPASPMEPALPAPPKKGEPVAKFEKKPEPEVSALVELAVDGQTMLLVYQQGGKKYTSQPISVVP